jgi:hypothetical protein
MVPALPFIAYLLAVIFLIWWIKPSGPTLLLVTTFLSKDAACIFLNDSLLGENGFISKVT